MAAQQELDANEPATPFKLEKAHERGSIVRSAELNFAVVLLACVACIYGLGLRAIAELTSLFSFALPLSMRAGLTTSSAIGLLGDIGARAVLAIAPIVFVIWVVVTIAAALQARGVFSAQPLVPDFSRVSPASGFQRIFSLRSLNELWRSVAKIAVVGVAMSAWGWHEFTTIAGLSSRSARAITLIGLDMLGSAFTLLFLIVLVFALMDWAFNRAAYMRQMRMSKRELKDERKEREGDPRIKARLRELRLEWMKRSRQLSRIRSADVLLTNPTHYAVALEYRHGETPAPVITARGAGELAHRMRKEARRNSVPVVENAPLARALFALDESRILVPEEHFNEVARVLRWVFAARASGSARTTS